MIMDFFTSYSIPIIKNIKKQVTPRGATYFFGAGDGNRTHTTSLEGWDSAIELHPRLTTGIIISQFLPLVNSFLLLKSKILILNK